MNKLPPFKKLLVVGGGTAGWLSVCYLAKMWAKHGVDIHIVESDVIGTIGVGEGTTPSIKKFFSELEIPSEEWMKACNATFKTGIRFANWSAKKDYKSYFHPFYSELDSYYQHEFMQNISLKHRGYNVHAHPDQFLLASELATKNKAPIAPKNYPFDTAYAYHFDAGLLATFLKTKAIEWGVTHHIATINNIKQAEDGSIKSVVSDTGESFEADFFVDCTGFKSMILGQTLGVPYDSFSKSLLNDSAVTIGTPMEDKTPNLTLSTALSAGWAWRIPLTNRFGNGYVYSSKHINAEQAEAELRTHLGLPDDIPAKHLKMRVGGYTKGWEKNCVAIGLAQSFIEPLEATALHFATQSVTDFVDAINTENFIFENRDLYNEKLHKRLMCVKDYIELHYLASNRNDTQYWIDVRSHQPSDRLKRIIKAWHDGENVPKVLDEDGVSLQLFSAESWLCLLAGKGNFPDSFENIDQLPEPLKIDMNKIKNFVEVSAKHYPTHDHILEELRSA
jgi:2-polyprenyl-6-methoxyphenol hydroxylase-like FAD-dependent oxidoreductase